MGIRAPAEAVMLRGSALLAVMLIALLACAPATRPSQTSDQAPPAASTSRQQPKRITVGIRGTAQVLNTKLNIGNAGLGVAEVERMVHAGLGQQDDAERPHATLAEALPTIENGGWVLLPDGRMETTWRI